MARLVQTKLEVGAAGDRFEQEADVVARDVMSWLGSGGVSRAVEEGTVRRQELEEEELLQASRVPGAMIGLDGGPLDSDSESVIARSRGGGHGLDGALRHEMEAAFGTDFSQVRVHTGPDTDHLNRAMGARAFTTGADVFVRSGDYSPSTAEGKRLIAHELTHVVQQGAAPILDDARPVSEPTATVRRSRVPPRLIHRLKAKGGSEEVNPEFTTGQAVIDRIQWYHQLGSTQPTVGIASEAVLDAAGLLWPGTAPANKARVYKNPQDKGKPRGWQANFWERPAAGGENSHNFHVSMRA